MTEIFDVTDADSSVLLNPEEKMLNTQLQYDDDWDEAITGSWMSAQPSMAEEGAYLHYGNFEDSKNLCCDTILMPDYYLHILFQI